MQGMTRTRAHQRPQNLYRPEHLYEVPGRLPDDDDDDDDDDEDLNDEGVRPHTTFRGRSAAMTPSAAAAGRGRSRRCPE
jgi:hypothetical protein